MMPKKILQGLNVLNFARGSWKPLCGPLKVQLELTNRCNSKCVTCGFWKQDFNDELATSDWMRIIDEAALMNVVRLSLTGGEPFLKKDIFQLIDHANRRNLKVNVNSNGLLVSKLAGQICESKIDSLHISLDSPNPDIHDKNRGIKGAFNKTIEGIKTLQQYDNHPSIQINMTINKQNIDELLPLVDFCRQLKVDSLTFEPAHSDSEFWNCPDELRITPDDLEKLDNNINEAIKMGKGLILPPFEYYKLFNKFFENPNYFRKYRFASGYSLITINSTGNVYASPYKKKLAGNVNGNSLKKIFFSKEFDQIREDFKRGNHEIYWFISTGPFDLAMHYLKTLNVVELAKIFMMRRY